MKVTMSTETASATGDQPEGERVHWRNASIKEAKPTANTWRYHSVPSRNKVRLSRAPRISNLKLLQTQAIQFDLIFDTVEKSWPVESVRLVHRLGVVPVNEPSLWVEVTAPHRAEAFAACQFVIDEMKQKVPIWKKPLPA